MQIKLGLRGSPDAVNHILIKLDDLTLMTTENLFLAGEEGRNKTGKKYCTIIRLPVQRPRNINQRKYSK